MKYAKCSKKHNTNDPKKTKKTNSYDSWQNAWKLKFTVGNKLAGNTYAETSAKYDLAS